MDSSFVELKTNIKGVFERILNRVDKTDMGLMNDLVNLLSFAQSESNLLTNVIKVIEVKYGEKEAKLILRVATLKAVTDLRAEDKIND